MKVVHICNLPLPPDHPDYGRVPHHRHPGRWVLNLAIAQRVHTQIEPSLVVQVPGASHDFSTTIEAIPVHFMAAPDRLRAATLFWFDARRIATRVRDLQPHLVHAHGTEDAYGLAAQRSGFPSVITLQGISFHINKIIKSPLISRARAVELTEAICLRRARHAIAKSDYVAARLTERFPHLIVHRIPNTVDPRLFEIREEKIPNLVAFVGTIIPRKGFDLVCQALEIVQRDVSDVRLDVFGDYPEAPSDYERKIKDQLRSILGERVTFHGAIPNLEVARQVAKAAALLAPSREEMFGNQLIEALVVGTHAIVTEGTAMAENVRRLGGGTIVPQENAEALAEAILSAVAVKNPAATADARRRVAEYMGPESVALQHQSLYAELLAGREKK